MKLLPAPRFHIMSPDEINESIIKVGIDRLICELEDEMKRIDRLLQQARDYRDWKQNVGIYAPSLPVPHQMKEDFYYGFRR